LALHLALTSETRFFRCMVPVSSIGLPSARLLVLLPLFVGACGAKEEAVPSGWRTVRIDGCCAVSLPPAMTSPPVEAGAHDPVRRFVRPGLAVSLEYGHQVSFPRMHTIQRGWAQERIEVDGREADLVSYDAQEADFGGGRAIHVRVQFPEKETYLAPPAPNKGMELGVNILCRTPADCEEGKRIARTADFPPVRTAT